VFYSPTVPPSAAHAKRAVKIAADGLPTRRRNMNVPESQIGDGEIARKMLVTDARHPQTRCERNCTSFSRYARK